MNDATRELGAALGIAVLGSVAASRYATTVAPALNGLSASAKSEASTSIAGALHVASSLPAEAGHALATSAQSAFVDGIHLAVFVGAILAASSAVIVWRKLPHSLTAQGALHGPLEGLEEAATLGLGGVPPVFADELPGSERSSDGAAETRLGRDRQRSA
jgi:hypothetical protein